MLVMPAHPLGLTLLAGLPGGPVAALAEVCEVLVDLHERGEALEEASRCAEVLALVGGCSRLLETTESVLGTLV